MSARGAAGCLLGFAPSCPADPSRPRDPRPSDGRRSSRPGRPPGRRLQQHPQLRGRSARGPPVHPDGSGLDRRRRPRAVGHRRPGGIAGHHLLRVHRPAGGGRDPDRAAGRLPFLQTADGDDAGAVLLASLSPSQIWNRGAVAQPRETPTGLTVPFGPAAEPSLASLTPGARRVPTWRSRGRHPRRLDRRHGRLVRRRPRLRDRTGGGDAQRGRAVDRRRRRGRAARRVRRRRLAAEVRVAERVDDRWRITPVATLSACGEGCPPPASIAMVGDTPLVVVAHPGSGDLIAAQRDGDAWTTEVAATGVSGGAALAATGDAAAISFATETGVSVASGTFGSWTIDEVAQASGVVSSGVAVDGEGTTWVAWEDGDGIHLASSAEGGFEEVEVSGTDGTSPSLATTEDGASVFLAWYDPESGDLRLGAYAEVDDLLVAAQSPPPKWWRGRPRRAAARTAADPRDRGAGHGVRHHLSRGARGAAVHDHLRQRGPAASQPLALRRPRVLGAPPTTTLDGAPVSETVEYDFDAIDEANTYYFQCDFHPIPSMRGTFVVVEGADGGGGGGGGAASRPTFPVASPAGATMPCDLHQAGVVHDPGRARRLPLPGRRSGRLRREGQLAPQAARQLLVTPSIPGPRPWSTRPSRRVDRRLRRGRRADAGVQPDPATQAAVQHPVPRRQVLPVPRAHRR